MATPSQEWRDAFRRARNATIAWALVAVAAATFASRQTLDSRVAVIVPVIFFAAITAAYGLWRLARLLVVRRDLVQKRHSVGRVYVALVDHFLWRNVHCALAVWMTDPRTEGEGLRRPDRVYMADLSERERTESYFHPTVWEAWTPVRPDGALDKGRWFQTAGNLVLVVRRGGPVIWLATARGFPDYKALVPARDDDVGDLAGLDGPIGFRGLGTALLWRLGTALALGLYVFYSMA